MKLASALLFGASVVAAAQHHQHRHVHRHADQHVGSPVERRAADVTEYVTGPTETEYVMDGVVLSTAEVEAGLEKGIYVLLTESSLPTPTASATPTPSSSSVFTSSASPSSSSLLNSAAEFFQKSSSSSSSSSSSTTSSSTTSSSISTSSSVYVPPTTSSYVPPTTSSAPPTTSSAPVTTSSVEVYSTSSAPAATSSPSYSSGGSSGSGISSEFPSGSIKCSEFPSSYGPIALDYLDLGGWSGIQNVPNFDFGVDSEVSYIETATSGGCSEKSFCSYACPAGYQKTQWPSAQGSTGESVGGLYCNADGYLELSNSNYNTLCMAGTGTIFVKNTLSDNIAICRTDYPGTESETIPTVAEAGSTTDLTCPDASDYYEWEGSFTSAQYYINPRGATQVDACQWGSAGSNLGNWAPLILGVGKTTSGTFISMFQNSPMNDDGKLDYSITIKGDVSGKCEYKNGKFYDSDGETTGGCTVCKVEGDQRSFY